LSRYDETAKRSALEVSAAYPRTRDKIPMAREGTVQCAQSRPNGGGGSGLNKTAQIAPSPTMAAIPLAPSLIGRQQENGQNKYQNVHPAES
jgi:hypothetical protein